MKLIDYNISFILICCGVLIYVKGNLQREFNLINDIPKRIQVSAMIKNLEKNPKYLSLPDYQKFRVLKTLMGIMEEFIEDKYSVYKKTNAGRTFGSVF
jgi:hypothetical protein